MSRILPDVDYARLRTRRFPVRRRPQQKRVKTHQEMVKNVRRGDTVVTNGGLVGKVTKVIDEEQIEIEIADDVRIRQMRSMLSDVRAKGEPVKEEAAAG